MVAADMLRKGATYAIIKNVEYAVEPKYIEKAKAQETFHVKDLPRFFASYSDALESRYNIAHGRKNRSRSVPCSPIYLVEGQKAFCVRRAAFARH